MDLTNNYFEIFELPEAYEIDFKLLAERYRDLQKKFHPDRFASHSAAQQKLAVQYTALINQAYSTLRSPVARAQYLLAQQGLESNHDNTTVNDPEFLMAQMNLRETLSGISDFPALETFTECVDREYEYLQQTFADQYSKQDLRPALTTVAKMQFYRKLRDEIEQLEEELDS